MGTAQQSYNAWASVNCALMPSVIGRLRLGKT